MWDAMPGPLAQAEILRAFSPQKNTVNIFVIKLPNMTILLTDPFIPSPARIFGAYISQEAKEGGRCNKTENAANI